MAVTVAQLLRMVEELQERVDALEAARGSARTGECRKGQDPETCSKASPYHYQQGCGGAACKAINTAYYSPAAKAARRAAKETPVKVTRKRGWGSAASNKS